jgi:hypothetical protein
MSKYKENEKYKVKCFKTSKDDENNKIPRACEIGILPKRLEQLGILCVGRTGSGKTNVLLHMLTDKNLLGGVFNKKDIFLYSALQPDKSLTTNLQIPKKNIITNWDEAKVKAHLEKIENVTKKNWKEAPYTFLIFDDVLQKKAFLKSATIANLVSTHRHHKICYAFLVQYYKSVAPVVRTNCSYIIYFAGSEMENIKLCDEQLPAFMTKKKFMQCVEFATKEPYSFLTINTRAEHNKKLRKGFNTIIN